MTKLTIAIKNNAINCGAFAEQAHGNGTINEIINGAADWTNEFFSESSDIEPTDAEWNSEFLSNLNQIVTAFNYVQDRAAVNSFIEQVSVSNFLALSENASRVSMLLNTQDKYCFDIGVINDCYVIKTHIRGFQEQYLFPVAQYTFGSLFIQAKRICKNIDESKALS
jgi:hypothetical protein